MLHGVDLEEITSHLSEQYPADPSTVRRAIFETVEQVKKGYVVPTHSRVVIEEWEDFVVINANLGSLTNRAFAHLIAHMVSEQIGFSVKVQHDPYRIFIQTLGVANAQKILEVLNEITNHSEDVIHHLLTCATVKTGLFKRRMVQVARRVGALERWVDFSKITLQNLLKSFEGTMIHAEALKEIFLRDLDLTHVLYVIQELQTGETELVHIKTDGIATPITRAGIERASMKTDLISPEKMKSILIESARVRLLSETRLFLCTNESCLGYVEKLELKDLPDKPECPKCGTMALAVLRDGEELIQSIVEKNAHNLTAEERKIWRYAMTTAKLMSKYGKPAAVALAGRRVAAADVEEVLLKEAHLSNHFFESIVDAERKALKRRFW
jgi:ATP-dependent Lhr-like helicase